MGGRADEVGFARCACCEVGGCCAQSGAAVEEAGAQVGEGAIGQSVARLGQAFGMRTLFAAHKGVSGLGPLYTPFDEVLETSDVITLHSPLLPGTRVADLPVVLGSFAVVVGDIDK